jgi:small subunit ribosomal protein S6
MRVRTYELMYIIDPTIGGDDEYVGITERITTTLTNTGATLDTSEPLVPTGRRKLAYPIRHQSRDLTEGFYVFQRFTAQPHMIAEIERSIKLTEEIIRYLLIVDEHPAPVTNGQ